MKDLIFSILRPFLEAYAMLRYKSIWGLKARLRERPGKLMKLTYGNYFLRRGSFVGLDSEFSGTPSRTACRGFSSRTARGSGGTWSSSSR